MESSFSMNYFSSSSSSTSSTTNTPSPPPLPPPPPHPNSRAVGEAESLTFKKLPSSQYKGVVPQPNGRWGAQIYEKHRRVWLGTFNMERDAARAYDLAAQRFRGRDAATNFPPLSPPNAGGGASNRELSFLLSRSKAEIVDMLRKHTYLDELLHFSPPSSSAGGGPVDPPTSPARPARELLFEKSVTPSDVGKLNRLVIPKQHAEKHFPAAGGGALLQFEEAGGGGGKVWRFRYSYWNSSQSYVLTKGWSRFVKEKGLAAGDSVCFYRSGGSDGEGQRQLYIECRPRGAGGGALMVRLFGVNIMKAAAAAPGMGGWGNENGKRSTLEGVEMGWMKKQCVGGL